MNKRSLIVQCSDKCPCDCPGCYNFSNNKKCSIPFEKFLNFIKSYNDIFENNRVTLSGGDPLFNSDIIKIISELKKDGVSINLDTVGTKLLEDRKELIEVLKMVDYVGIPLDGITTRTIQAFRTNMTIEKFVRILNVVKDFKNICINTVVHALNIEEIKGIASLINEDKQITKWQLFQYMPIGPGGYKNKVRYEITEEQYNKVKSEVLSLDLRHSLQLDFKSAECRIDRYLILSSDGTVWIPGMNNERTIVGDIEDGNIFNFIERSSQYEKI